jgi:hypothetical protein
LKQEKEGNNEIVGAIIVTSVKTTWISLPCQMTSNFSIDRDSQITSVADMGDENQIETHPIRSLSPLFLHEENPAEAIVSINAGHCY